MHASHPRLPSGNILLCKQPRRNSHERAHSVLDASPFETSLDRAVARVEGPGLFHDAKSALTVVDAGKIKSWYSWMFAQLP